MDRKKEHLDGLYRSVQERERGYRARALRMFPHVCASCGREFEGKKLKELTVHHKDHNHDNNPPDGSNWELLCIYCHDHEHEKHKMKGLGGGAGDAVARGSFAAFSDLDQLLKGSSDGEASG
jgi:5-methylcytosine-specific restriction endonuclease McrA